MTRSSISAVLALVISAAFVTGAHATYQTPKHHHHPRARIEARHAGDIYVDKRTRSYLDPGTSAEVDTEDLFFNDTKYPRYLLGPGLLQRFDEGTGMSY